MESVPKGKNDDDRGKSKYSEKSLRSLSRLSAASNAWRNRRLIALAMPSRIHCFVPKACE